MLQVMTAANTTENTHGHKIISSNKSQRLKRTPPLPLLPWILKIPVEMSVYKKDEVRDEG